MSKYIHKNRLVKKVVRALIFRGITFVNSRPGLLNHCISLARRFGLYKSLRTFYLHFPVSIPQVLPGSIMVEQLGPHANRIYRELKAAIEEYQEEIG